LSAGRHKIVRRVPAWLAGLIATVAVAACSGGVPARLPVSRHTQTYHGAGWTVEVPPGWHAVPFRDSRQGITSAGVQLSNVRLPLPSLVPGYPIQVSSRVLPARGVGLIIATDPDPSLSHYLVSNLPLPAPDGHYWTTGSSLAGTPYMELLWFRAHGMMFIACAKVGSRATSRDLNAIAMIVRSLR
jgi:hypothetical protein